MNFDFLIETSYVSDVPIAIWIYLDVGVVATQYCHRPTHRRCHIKLIPFCKIFWMLIVNWDFYLWASKRPRRTSVQPQPQQKQKKNIIKQNEFSRVILMHSSGGNERVKSHTI